MPVKKNIRSQKNINKRNFFKRPTNITRKFGKGLKASGIGQAKPRSIKRMKTENKNG